MYLIFNFEVTSSTSKIMFLVEKLLLM
jgi:hypothetical protein